MRSNTILVLLALTVAGTAAAQQDDKLTGSVEVGYRNVDVNGNLDKYREDVNLDDDAARLFGLRIDYRPDSVSWFDTLLLDASDLGGEPNSHAKFVLRKTTVYDLNLRYRSADRFYRDAGYFFREGGDLHTWDTRREFFNLGLKVETTDWLTLRFGADRTGRDGGSTTSRDVQRDVFQLDRPVDQESSAYWAAADFRWAWADFTIEQRFYSQENRWTIGTSNNPGVDETDSAVLDDYVQTRDEETDAPITRLSVRGRPLDWFRFVADVARVDAEGDFDTQGAWNGVDYTGAAFQTTLMNRGAVERTSDLVGVDLFFTLLPKLELIVDFSQRSYEQNGSIDSVQDQVGGAEEGTIFVRGDLTNDLDLDTAGLTVDWRATRAVSVMAGFGWQERTKQFELSGPPVQTERTVYRGGVRWNPGTVWDLRLDYGQGDDDEPLTQVSPTSTDRLRFRARVRPLDGLTLAFNLLDESRENDLSYPLGMPTDDVPPATEVSLAKFDVSNAALTVLWSKGALDLSAGYSAGEVDSDAHIVFVTGSTFFPAFDIFTSRDRTAWVSDYDVVNASIQYAIGSRWHVGGRLTVTDNTGSFPIQTDYYAVFGRYDHRSGLFVRALLESYDYSEDNPFAGDPAAPMPDVNDYDADLWTVSLGYRF